MVDKFKASPLGQYLLMTTLIAGAATVYWKIEDRNEINISRERQIATRQQKVDTNISNLDNKIKSLRSDVDELDISIDDEERKSSRIEEALRTLQNQSAANKTRVDLVASDVEKNSQDHVDQKQRANTRAGDRKVRDEKINLVIERIEEIEEWRNSSQIDQLDIVLERVEFLQDQLNKIQAQ